MPTVKSQILNIPCEPPEVTDVRYRDAFMAGHKSAKIHAARLVEGVLTAEQDRSSAEFAGLAVALGTMLVGILASFLLVVALKLSLSVVFIFTAVSAVAGLSGAYLIIKARSQ